MLRLRNQKGQVAPKPLPSRRFPYARDELKPRLFLKRNVSTTGIDGIVFHRMRNEMSQASAWAPTLLPAVLHSSRILEVSTVFTRA